MVKRNQQAFLVVEQDIAAANIAFQLVQAVIQKLLKKDILDRAETLTLLRDMARYYRQPGRPDRASVRVAAAAALDGIVLQLQPSASDQSN